MIHGMQGTTHQKWDLLFYLILAGIFVLLKLAYSRMDTNDLQYFLMPINGMIQLAVNSDSHYIMGRGYYHEEFNILIDKSCSGFNFFVLCYTMLGFLFIKYSANSYQRFFLVFGLLPVAYILGLFVNSARIVSAIFIQGMNDTLLIQKSALLHQIEGVFIYLFFLVVIYSVFERVLTKRVQYNA